MSKFKIPRQLRRRWHEIIASRWPRSVTPSHVPLAIVMPLARKDAAVAEHTIASLKKHIRHPIQAFIIVGQDCQNLRDLSAKLDVTFIPEGDVLAPYLDHPIVQKSGWLKQQFIKLSVFDFTSFDNVLVHDSDTIALRDIDYIANGKPILNLVDEYTKKFFLFPRLIWPEMERHPRSFVAHGMLLQRAIMARLNQNVTAQHGDDLRAFILKNLSQANYDALSEFEIYGNYLNSFERNAFKTRYWYNVKANPKNMENTKHLEAFIARRRRFNSVSVHVHDILD
jgi:Family of unknown function (DUF6492)